MKIKKMTMVHTLSVCLVTATMITSVSSMGRFTTVPADVDGELDYDGPPDCAFRSSVAVGTKVVFVPSGVNDVGIFDTVTNTFSTVNTNMTMGLKFSGGTAVGTKVVFAPAMPDGVGVFDTATNKFSSVDTGLNDAQFALFDSTVAVGTKVVLIPYDVDVVGVFDTETDTFSAVNTALTMKDRFTGAIAVGTKVVFPPCISDVVGILDLSPSPTPPSNNENPDLGLIIGLTVGGAVVLGGLVYYFYFARVNKVQSPIAFPFQKLVF